MPTSECYSFPIWVAYVSTVSLEVDSAPFADQLSYAHDGESDVCMLEGEFEVDAVVICVDHISLPFVGDSTAGGIDIANTFVLCS